MLIAYLVLLCECFREFSIFTFVDLRSIFTDIRSYYWVDTKENLISSNNEMSLQRMLLKERYLMSSLPVLKNERKRNYEFSMNR